MMVPANIKARVKAKLEECIATAEAHYGQKFRMPKIEYTLRGRTAGTANYGTWVVNFNSVLLMENLEDFIARTVPHEMAHLINDQVYPESHATEIVRTYRGYRRTKRSPHGHTWQSVMRVLGADPSRCHSYDTTNSRVKKGNRAKHVYVCKTCQAQMKLGPKRHAKVQSGASRYWLRGCGRHAGFTYVGLEGAEKAPEIKLPKAADAPKPKKSVPGIKSKLDLCREWFNPSLSRAQNIANFVNEVCCTPAGASSYYSKIKSER